MSVEKTTAPRTVQDARRAVEQSRERIAATLDELEDRIVETKASIKRKADVARPAREAIQKAPLVAIGLAVAVGLFLGTRGGDDDEDEDGYGFEKDERRALEEWRKRRRKMLLEEAESDAESFEDEVAEPGPFGRLMRSVGREVAGVAIGIIAAEIGERLYGARAGGAESEVSDDASDEPCDGDYDEQ
jgi:ElaB/YqjD/DUF883 family membrane-anchored ribosome-binding protein